jgi:hypothetical protein
MTRFTRRRLLARGGATLGAATVVSVGGAGVAGSLAAGPAPGFNAERQRTYGALVDAVAAAPETSVHAGLGTDVTQTFGAWYQGRSPARREQVDEVLDQLETSLAGKPFWAHARSKRLGLLRDSSHGRNRAPNAAVISLAALELSAIPFNTDAEFFHHPTVTTFRP